MPERPYDDADVETVTGALTSRPHGRGARHARQRARAVLDALTGSGRWLRIDPDEPHLIEFRADGWTIQHPLRCRPDLFDCEVNRVGEQLPGPPTQGLGLYECSLVDDALVIGQRHAHQEGTGA